MKNNHKHDHCKHARLKFCADCQTPHCLDCGQEWNKERVVYAPYNWYWLNGTSYTPSYTTTTGYSQPAIDAPVITCSHTN